MNHIDKMAMAMHGRHGSDAEEAQAAFDALMDAVPDLGWHGSSCSYGVKNTYTITENPAKPKNFSVVWLGGALGVFATVEAAKAAANVHNREQVRKIWESTS